MVQEPGGGVCQVSSTLYNAVVFAGLKTTERHAHTYEPSYVTPGEDAMVSYDGYAGPDLRFVNNGKTAIGIKASIPVRPPDGFHLRKPDLRDGVTVSMHSEKIKETGRAGTDLCRRPDSPAGYRSCRKGGNSGQQMADEPDHEKERTGGKRCALHNSTYTGKGGDDQEKILPNGCGDGNAVHRVSGSTV